MEKITKGVLNKSEPPVEVLTRKWLSIKSEKYLKTTYKLIGYVEPSVDN